MYNQHKILRVFQLINLLKTKPAKSIRQLAKTLEVDTRTIYRYFDLIKEIGFDAEKDAFNRYFIQSEEKQTHNLMEFKYVFIYFQQKLHTICNAFVHDLT